MNQQSFVSRCFVQFAFALSAVTVLASLGCGEAGPRTSHVTGVVTLNGEPLEQVALQFAPDSLQDGRRVESTALTDTQGRYELVYKIPSSKSNTPITGKGAVSGTHTVTVTDYKMMAEHLPRPGRVPLQYTKSETTPLRLEVGEAEAVIDIELER